MNQKIETLESSVSSITKELLELKDLISKGFIKVDINFNSIKKEIDTLHGKVDSLNMKVDKLKGNTTDGFSDVGLKLENLSDEISKINTVTNYDKQFINLGKFKN